MSSREFRIHHHERVLAQLVDLAEHLRRTNPEKWGVTSEQWETAFREVLLAPTPEGSDPPRVAHAIRAAQNAARRLADSGNARLGAAGVARHPNSSIAGRRFYADLATAKARLEELRRLRR